MKSKLNANPLFIILIIVLLTALACGGTQDVPLVVTDQPIETPSLPTVVVEEPAEQRSQTQEGEILFQDDFQDGSPDGWDITSGWDVQQAGDVYTFEASGSGGAWVPEGSNWNNYAYQAAARLDAGSLLLSFGLNQSGRYMVRMDEAGLFLIKESPSKKYTVVKQTGPVTLGEWHRMDLRAYNGHIQVYVDDQLWVDYTDSAPFSQGSIAVTAQNGSRVAVDDVLVTKTPQLSEGIVQAPAPLDLEVEMDMGEGSQVVVEPDAGDQASEEQKGAQAQDQVDEQDDQQGEDQAQAGGLPDLVVVNAYFDPDQVGKREQFLANFEISNQGNAPSGAFTLLWKFHAATGISVCSWDYDGLEPGETVWGGCPRTTNAQPGQSPTSLTVDINSEIAESDENNNQLTPPLVVAAADGGGDQGQGEAELPDFTPIAIELLSDNHSIRCDVKNLGPGDAPAGAKIRLTIGGRDSGTEILGAIPVGGTNSVVFAGLDIPTEHEMQVHCYANIGETIPEVEGSENNKYLGTVFIADGGNPLPDLWIPAMGVGYCQVKNVWRYHSACRGSSRWIS